MKKLFSPGIKLINRLKYPQKFSIVSLLLALFIAALIIVINIGLNRQIDFIQKQRIGLEYIEPVREFLFSIESHCGLAAIEKFGVNSNLKQKVPRLDLCIETNLNRLKEVNKKYKNIFYLSDEIDAVSSDWLDFKQKMPELNEEELFREYNNIAGKINKLIVKIGDKSNLSLAPELQEFYLAHSIIWDAPLLIKKTGKIKYTGTLALAKKQLTDKQKIQIIIDMNLLQSELAQINENSQKVTGENPETNDRIKAALEQMNNDVLDFLNLIDEQFIKNPPGNIEPVEFLSSGEKVINSASGLYMVKLKILDDFLAGEIQQIKITRFIINASTVLIILGIAYIFTCFTFSVVDGVKYLQDRAMRLAEGDLNVRSELETEDELKNLSDSLNTMISSIKNLIIREKIIKDIVSGSLESVNINNILSTVVSSTAKIFGADMCFFVEYDPEKETFAPVEKHNCYISSSEDMDITGMQLSKELMQPITDHVFLQKKVMVVDDVDKLDFPDKTMELIRKCKVKSFMAAPLFYASVPVGMLLVQSTKKPRKYKKEDITLIESISYQSSLAINQARLMEQIKRKTEALELALSNEKILRKITTESSLCKTHEEIDNYVLNELSKIFNVSRVVHLHVDNDFLRWYGKMEKEKNIEVLEGQCFVPSDSAKEIIPAPEEVLVFNNIDEQVNDEYLKNCLRIEGIKSLIAYPTSKKFPGRQEKGVIEITVIACSQPRTWTKEEKYLFTVIMDTLSIVTLETIQRRELEEIRKTFISTLTHDLKSPLLAEQKALEFLLSPRGKQLDPSEYLEDIYKTNEDLLKLINNLLSSYHYESGKWKLNKTHENIEEVIKKVISTLTPLAAEQDDEIIFEPQESLPCIYIDIIEIKRVLINLISNAVKHNDKGVRITLKAKKVNNSIQVSVKDNGKGIAEEFQSRIFLKYTSQKGKMGTGLGLYISKQIIEAHNGKIWFETEAGKGTTFYFTLPLSLQEGFSEGS